MILIAANEMYLDIGTPIPLLRNSNGTTIYLIRISSRTRFAIQEMRSRKKEEGFFLFSAKRFYTNVHIFKDSFSLCSLYLPGWKMNLAF